MRRFWAWLRGERWLIVAISEWQYGRSICYRQHRACVIDHRHVNGTRHPTIPNGTRDKWHCLDCHAERDMTWAEHIDEW